MALADSGISYSEPCGEQRARSKRAEMLLRRTTIVKSDLERISITPVSAVTDPLCGFIIAKALAFGLSLAFSLTLKTSLRGSRFSETTRDVNSLSGWRELEKSCPGNGKTTEPKFPGMETDRKQIKHSEKIFASRGSLQLLLI
eukprot:TRINITY_DN543_c0_g1_i4.p1 TRINITY_DN543_c0_g1~~TRINITY_DN543_c0_g1_i4.p1  ORF type:complete len:143 (-),score=6.16 TRINITY_DN543_c0_g1_i4:226-654(-)